MIAPTKKPFLAFEDYATSCAAVFDIEGSAKNWGAATGGTE